MPAVWWGNSQQYDDFTYTVQQMIGNEEAYVGLNSVCAKDQWDSVGFGPANSGTVKNQQTGNNHDWRMNLFRGLHHTGSSAANTDLDPCQVASGFTIDQACTSLAANWVTSVLPRFPWASNRPAANSNNRCAVVKATTTGIELLDKDCKSVGNVKMVMCMSTDGHMNERLSQLFDTDAGDITYRNSWLFADNQIMFDDTDGPLLSLQDDVQLQQFANYEGGISRRFYPLRTQGISDFIFNLGTENTPGDAFHKDCALDTIIQSGCEFSPSDLNIVFRCTSQTAPTSYGFGSVGGVTFFDFETPGDGRRLNSVDDALDRSRVVQWGDFFRQPSHGEAPTNAFSGPTFADCDDPLLPDSHCCRTRTTFWVTQEQARDRVQSVTRCEEVCQLGFLRTGSDDACVPVQPECNDWAGKDSPEYDHSDVILIEAWCLCGMKASVVPRVERRERRGLASAWTWDNSPQSAGTVDPTTAFAATDQCAASALSFLTRNAPPSTNQSCPMASGALGNYLAMGVGDLDSGTAYSQCNSHDGLLRMTPTEREPFVTGSATVVVAAPHECCAVPRDDAAPTRRYAADGSATTQSVERLFGVGEPFQLDAGVDLARSNQESHVVLAHDFDLDGQPDLVRGPLLFLSSNPTLAVEFGNGNAIVAASAAYVRLAFVPPQLAKPAAEQVVTNANGVPHGATPTSTQIECESHLPVLLQDSAQSCARFAMPRADLPTAVAIAYADNTVVLYTAVRSATAVRVVELVANHSWTVARGTPTAVQVFSSRVSDGVGFRRRVGIYVAVANGPDLIFRADEDDSGDGRPTLYTTRTLETTADANSQSVALLPFPIASDYALGLTHMSSPPPPPPPDQVYEYDFTTKATFTNALVVGTGVGSPNLLVFDEIDETPRQLPDSEARDTVAVRAKLNATSIRICEGNRGGCDRCLTYELPEDHPPNVVVPERLTTAPSIAEFGCDVETSDLALWQDDLVLTIAPGGYVRAYRDTPYLATVPPETTDHRLHHIDAVGIIGVGYATGDELFATTGGKLAVGQTVPAEIRLNIRDNTIFSDLTADRLLGFEAIGFADAELYVHRPMATKNCAAVCHARGRLGRAEFVLGANAADCLCGPTLATYEKAAPFPPPFPPLDPPLPPSPPPPKPPPPPNAPPPFGRLNIVKAKGLCVLHTGAANLPP
jgi:hypothetical protein